jgi:small subunit ribosomal protein S9
MAEEIQKPKPKAKTKVSDYIRTVGRRKTAVARVRLYKKSGDMIVNDLPVGQYFPGEVAGKQFLKPFEITNTIGKFSFSAKVEGSGKAAQLDAVVHGLSRALATLDVAAYRTLLKKEGLLTRDSRMKESRKVGTGGKARRKKQSPKR